MIIYKACSKAQLAEYAGVSTSTMREWCRKFEEKFKQIDESYKPTSKMLAPGMVKILSEHYDITPENIKII